MKVKDPNSDPVKEKEVQMDIKKPEYKKEQVIKDDIALLLVRQISRELFNHNLYATFADYFKLQGLCNLEKYYEDRAKEEINHHQWIVDYLKECSVPFAYPQVDAVEVDITDNVYPFDKTVRAEIETTEWINEIVKAALKEGDFQTFYWLKKLVDEQVEEESLSLKALQLATSDTDWITKGDAILALYEDEQE